MINIHLCIFLINIYIRFFSYENYISHCSYGAGYLGLQAGEESTILQFLLLLIQFTFKKCGLLWEPTTWTKGSCILQLRDCTEEGIQTSWISVISFDLPRSTVLIVFKRVFFLLTTLVSSYPCRLFVVNIFPTSPGIHAGVIDVIPCTLDKRHM